MHEWQSVSCVKCECKYRFGDCSKGPTKGGVWVVSCSGSALSCGNYASAWRGIAGGALNAGPHGDVSERPVQVQSGSYDQAY